MTWIELVRYYKPDIDNKAADRILWGETCFPMGDIKTISRQIRSALRAMENKIKRCEICGVALPYHKYKCPKNTGE